MFRKWQELMDAKREKLGPEKWAEHERKVREELERIQGAVMQTPHTIAGLPIVFDESIPVGEVRMNRKTESEMFHRELSRGNVIATVATKEKLNGIPR
jgi:hypothetical protein